MLKVPEEIKEAIDLVTKLYEVQEINKEMLRQWKSKKGVEESLFQELDECFS